MQDIVIVGAGPVGLYLAKLLEEHFDIVILEKSSDIGKKACSGLYSTNINDFLDLKEEWIEHTVTGAKVHSYDGIYVQVKKPSVAAYVVDREKFNKGLAENLKSEIRLGCTVTGLDYRDDHVEIETTTGSLQAKLVVGADGANSFIRQAMGVEPQEMVNGLIAIAKENNADDFVDIYVDKDRIHDGFFWKIPRGTTVEYGALGKNVTYTQLEEYFHLKDYKKHAAFMNVGIIKTNFNRTILLGEAACQVKPWSFGGIIFGFSCAKIAADVIRQAFSEQNFSEDFLARYDSGWKEKIRKNITVGMMMRSMLKEMDNPQVSELFKQLKGMEKLNTLDMDFPGFKMFDFG